MDSGEIVYANVEEIIGRTGKWPLQLRVLTAVESLSGREAGWDSAGRKTDTDANGRVWGRFERRYHAS